MNKKLEVTYDTLTKRGGRAVNEDYLGCGQDNIFVLCDGLGGHGKGEVASRFVVEHILSACCERKMTIEEAIVSAQNGLLEKQKEENAQDAMKTTVTCLKISEDKAKFAHVGDSRVYYFENSKFRQRSIDHSVPQMLVKGGIIKEKDIRHHEDRSRLLSVMGTEWNSPKYQVVDDIPLNRKTTFLLCSDGFWELIDEKMMSQTLKKAKTPGEWLTAMEEIVVRQGQGTDMDNYSAIAVFIR